MPVVAVHFYDFNSTEAQIPLQAFASSGSSQQKKLFELNN